MKKILLATGIFGVLAAQAHAQSNITIYGSVDGGVRWVNNANAAGDSNVTMSSNGTYNSNRLGFRGVEDLGGGLNAHFNLETGLNTGTGTLDNTTGRLFNRSAFVGIGGQWGSLDFGRQYSVNFKTISVYDPFNYKYTGLIPLAGQGGLTRLDNDVQYIGTFGPITARAEWALGETAGDSGRGARRAAGATFVAGPLSAGAAYTRSTSATDVDTDNWTAGAAYRMGVFRVAAGFARNDTDGGAEIDDTWIGGSFAATPAFELTAGYYRTKADTAVAPRRDMIILGATYAFSKRTNLYADIDRSRFRGEGSPALWGVQRPGSLDKLTAVSVGLNHFF